MKNIKKYEKLKKELQNIGVIIPGRLRTTYLRCGKINCICQKSKKQIDMHGPYIFWDRKVNEKLSSMSINTEDVKDFEQWIQNKIDFDKIVNEMKKLGQEIASMSKTKMKSG